MKAILATVATGFSLLMGSALANAATVTLYNGSLGSAPGAQGWVFSATPGATQAVGGGGTTFGTTSNDLVRGGYARTDQTLNRTTGYTFSFNIQLLSENHSNPNAQNNPAVDNIADRAGFSIIVLSSDLQGIELGFWTDDSTTTNRIWAQEDGPVKADPVSAPSGTRFTHAEGTSFNPSSGVNQYDLSVVGSTYSLYANGSPILSGSLRDYTPEGAPYTTPNFIFLGDNTTSARGSFLITQAAVTDAPIVPPTPVPFEFSPAMGLLALGAVYGVQQLREKLKQ